MGTQEDFQRDIHGLDQILQQFEGITREEINQGETFEDDNYVVWHGFHPDLVPTDYMVEEEFSREFTCIAKKDLDGVVTEGWMISDVESEDEEQFCIYFTRDDNNSFVVELKDLHGNDVDDSFWEDTPTVDIIAFTQRSGHGPRQAAALDCLVKEGGMCTIASPEWDQIETDAAAIPLVYLNEVGYTTNLRKNKHGETQASLPTDPRDERFMLSLMALTSANWRHFKMACIPSENRRILVSDSKAEIGALGVAIQRGINPNLHIVLMAYTIFDRLDKLGDFELPDNEEIKEVLERVGLSDWGVPDGLFFMRQKVEAVKDGSSAVILHMSFDEPNEAVENAHKTGVENVVFIPQLTRAPQSFPEKQASRNTLELAGDAELHTLQLGSSSYAQAPEILTLFIDQARRNQGDRFIILGREDMIQPHLDELGELPKNLVFEGWVSDPELFFTILSASDTLWVRGGNRNSVTEAIELCLQRGTVPILLTPDQLTDSWVDRWAGEEFSIEKLISIMMTVETMTERWDLMASLILNTEILERIIVDPLATDPEELESTIQELRESIESLWTAFISKRVADVTILASIYDHILRNGINVEELQELVNNFLA